VPATLDNYMLAYNLPFVTAINLGRTTPDTDEINLVQSTADPCQCVGPYVDG